MNPYEGMPTYDGPPIVALDWDETVTLDLGIWGQMVRFMTDHQWQVYICTWRSDTDEYRIEQWKLDAVAPTGVVYCDRKSKYDVMRDAGINVSFWVDDKPHAILYDIGDKRGLDFYSKVKRDRVATDIKTDTEEKY